MTQPVPVRRGPGRPRDVALPERRRRQILASATRQFAQNGYAATDVQQVADELGVGKGTIYRYFPTKEVLFLASVDQGMQQLKVAIDLATAPARSDLERVELGVRAYLEFFDQHADIIELVIQERANFRHRRRPTYFLHRDANLGPWQDLFRGLIADGLVRPVPVERVTDVISDLLYGTIFTNHFAGRSKSLTNQCQDVLDILFHGLLGNQPSGEGNG